MKVTYKVLLIALLAGFALGGCAEKDVAAPAEEAMEEVTEAAGDAVEAAGDAVEAAGDAVEEAVSNEPGGYVPTEEERVPGETRP
jgi:hypothetical protein